MELQEIDEQKRNEKFIRMTQMPIQKIIPRMAVPTIISMLISSFYNMVDTIYVGHLDNTESSAAVGVAFSFMALIQAIGFFFGHGSGNFISRSLGKKEYDKAKNMAATGFFLPIAVGTLIMVLGLLFTTPLSRMLGATETALPYTNSYLRWLLLGTPFMMSSLVMNNQLRLQGSAQIAMVGITFGAVLNIALDPVFIFKLGMGVGGAALATIISQFISWLLLLGGCAQKGNISISLKNLSPHIWQFGEIVRCGLPSLCRQGIASVAVIALNWAVKGYGDSAIAAFSIVSRITTFAGSAMIGFGQGFQPVCGFSYGAGLYERVVKAFWFCVKVSTVILVLLSVAGFILAPGLISLFRSGDPLLITIGSRALRFQCLSFPLTGLIIMTNMMLQNIGKTLPASVLAMGRQGVFFLPLLPLLSAAAGLTGIEFAQPAADILTFALAVPLSCHAVKQMRAL
ncbi:MATE family efflux transporter [Ruminococcus gauvreauii]|uniref:MATE family efflux transporter n=1 Tax=Ruminococcus gauvreauii TaxID=438033 RepID=UPI003984006B